MRRFLNILGQPATFLIKSTLIALLFIVKLTPRLAKKLEDLLPRLIPKSFHRLTIPSLPSILFPPLPRLPFLSLPHLPTFPKIPKLRLPKVTIPRTNKFISLGLLCVALLSFLTYKWFSELPSITLLQDPPSLTTKILDRNGTLLYQIYRDENRTLINLSDLPTYLINATLSAEDKNFYSHHGLDYLGIVRAFGKNLKNCRFFTTPCSPEGGSTLTQQLIKNTLLSPKKTIDRKMKEAVLALMVEQKYSKDKILELYLNEVSYGGIAYGIQAGAEYYFGKNAKDLTLAESALLSGLTISPTTLSPLGSHPYLAKDRQLEVLRRMVQNGHITKDEEQAAINETLTLRPKNISIAAPHFVMWIKEQLVDTYGEEMVSQGGLTITTTLDLPSQKILENEITQELKKLKNLNVTNGAGIVTNPPTGEILAMVGSHNYYDYQHDGQVNLTIAERQPGSSIKPITYVLGLMKGLSPGSTIDDSPICFPQPGSTPYCPKNYDGKFHGTVTLRSALANSYNIPAVKLLNSLGVSNMVKLAESLGITTWTDSSRFGLALTLGGGEVKMVDMAEVYGTFANYGTRVPLKGILSISDATGKNISQIKNTLYVEVIPTSIAFQINSILSDNSARSSAFGFNSVLSVKNQQVAVKTGTTNSLRDNWTFGYTKDVLVGTWVGNNDNTPMSAVVSGITGASPIWRRTIDQLTKKFPPNTFTPPKGTKKIALCRETKGIYCKNICPSAPIYEYFTPGTEPRGTCEQQSGIILKEAATTN